MKFRLFVCLAALIGASVANAHEFWIEPREFAISPGDQIVAETRVGQAFAGSSYAYIPQNFRRFALSQGEGNAAVQMRTGDKPALDVEMPSAGLAIIQQVSRDYTLVYNDTETFRSFVEHKDALWVLDRHLARGLPEAGFKERYSRYAKSLVAVGDGAGQDRAFGLLTEIVALANPYTDDLSGGLPVQVLYDGAPKPDAQVEVFAKRGDQVTVSTVRADADGRALVPVKAGVRYMLDSVVLREVPEGAEDGAVWESLWANLTFAVPE